MLKFSSEYNFIIRLTDLNAHILNYLALNCV